MATIAPPALAEPPRKPPRRRRRWLRRTLLAIVAVIAVVALLVVLATAWAVRRPFPQTSGTLTVPGLNAQVTVQRDAWGIPAVTASTSHDLFFAQGFVNAQDRFWEMDFRRHVTAGRLSELFGDTTLETDEFVRTMGWRRVAEAEVNLMSPQTLALLQAYADGVNAYVLNRSPSELSLEYSVLALTNRGYTVEPWTPADSLAWLKAMSFDLSGNAWAEIERVLVTAEVGARRAGQIFPEYPFDRHRPILDQGAWVGTGSNARFDQNLPAPGATTTQTAAYAGVEGGLRSIQSGLAQVSGLLGLSGQHAGAGSNNWVVSGELTATGKPLLANDPHLAPSMPSIWTQLSLHCAPVSAQCPYDVAGYTFSGFPGVIIGHNARVAWGFTNLAPDTQDLFLESLQADAAIVDGVAVPLQTREEVIKVAGADPVTITVRSTAHGPLMSDVSDDYAEVGQQVVPPSGSPTPTAEEGYAVALQWTALTPGKTAEAVFALDGAGDSDEVRAAAGLFETPSQNIVYADVDGNIGYVTGGKFPVRAGYDGLTPAPGWDSSVGWVGDVPQAAVPAVENPSDGFIVTANNQLTNPGLGYDFVVDNAFGARSQRITDRIAAATTGGRKITAADMSDIQNDTYNEPASWVVPLAMAVRLDGSASAARSTWDGWDFTMAPDSAAAAYFGAFWTALVNGVFGDELGDEVALDSTDRWYEAMRALDADDPWWDDLATPEVEDRSAMLQRAMQLAAADLSDQLGDDPATWTWKSLHTLEIRNQTFGDSGIGPIEWLFNRGPYETGGSGSSPDATDWDTRDGYGIVWIPSMRMVVDLADLDASTWVNLTGASGHAFAEHYDDQAELWATGRTTPFVFSAPATTAAAEKTLTLTP